MSNNTILKRFIMEEIEEIEYTAFSPSGVGCNEPLKHMCFTMMKPLIELNDESTETITHEEDCTIESILNIARDNIEYATDAILTKVVMLILSEDCWYKGCTIKDVWTGNI